MKIKEILEKGIEQGFITEEQKEQLLSLDSTSGSDNTDTSSIAVKALYYIGGFIAFCAMTLLMMENISNGTYFTIFGLGIFYCLIFWGLGELLWKKQEIVPSNIIYLLLITCFSLVILDVEKWTGFFPRFSDMDKLPHYWAHCLLPTCVLSIITSLLSAKIIKLRKLSTQIIPIITCIYSTLLCFLMTIANNNDDWLLKGIIYISLIYSLSLIIFGYIKDRITAVDYSKWLYLFGSIGFYKCFMLMTINIFSISNVYILHAISLALGLLYLLFGNITRRRVFTFWSFLIMIEYIIFHEIMLIKGGFIFTTSVYLITGLAILLFGVLYHKNEEKLALNIEKILPKKMRNNLPTNREQSA